MYGFYPDVVSRALGQYLFWIHPVVQRKILGPYDNLVLGLQTSYLERNHLLCIEYRVTVHVWIQSYFMMGLWYTQIISRLSGPVTNLNSAWLHGAFRWQYFGSRSGLLRVNPRLELSDAVLSADYDPRQQSWYTSSTMLPVNAVIIVDTSSSMNGSRYLPYYVHALPVVWTLHSIGKVSITNIGLENIGLIFSVYWRKN